MGVVSKPSGRSRVDEEVTRFGEKVTLDSRSENSKFESVVLQERGKQDKHLEGYNKTLTSQIEIISPPTLCASSLR